MGAAQCAAPVGQVIYGVLFETFRANVYLPILLISVVMFGVAIVSQRSFEHEGDIGTEGIVKNNPQLGGYWKARPPFFMPTHSPEPSS